jgi:hypothetical protein
MRVMQSDSQFHGDDDMRWISFVSRGELLDAALQLYSTGSNGTINFFPNAPLGGTRLGNNVAV